MAIRDDFAPGEVLASADLNDTFASKVPFSYGTATPSTTVEGFIWFDENDTPPTAKVWDGSDFVTFSGAGNADFSDAATGTYTDGGVNYKYKTYTGNGTLTVTRSGLADVLIISAGCAGGVNLAGSGGRMITGELTLPAGTLTVTVGAINSPAPFGGFSQLGSLITGASPGYFGGNFPGGTTDDTNATTGIRNGLTSSITGTALEYGKEGRKGAPTANRGDGGETGGGNNGSAGVVIVRVRTN